MSMSNAWEAAYVALLFNNTAAAGIGLVSGAAVAQTDAPALGLLGWAMVAGQASQSDTAAAHFEHGFVRLLTLRAFQTDTATGDVWPIRAGASPWLRLPIEATAIRRELAGVLVELEPLATVTILRKVEGQRLTQAVPAGVSWRSEVTE